MVNAFLTLTVKLPSLGTTSAQVAAPLSGLRDRLRYFLPSILIIPGHPGEYGRNEGPAHACALSTLSEVSTT